MFGGKSRDKPEGRPSASLVDFDDMYRGHSREASEFEMSGAVAVRTGQVDIVIQDSPREPQTNRRPSSTGSGGRRRSSRKSSGGYVSPDGSEREMLEQEPGFGVNELASDGLVTQEDLNEDCESILIWTKVYGPTHEAVLKATVVQAQIDMRQNNMKDAILHCKRALYICEQLVNKQSGGSEQFSRSVFLRLEALGQAYVAAKLLPAAEAVFRKCIQYSSPLYDPDHEIHQRCIRSLREILMAQGKDQEVSRLEASLSGSVNDNDSTDGTGLTKKSIIQGLSRRFQRTSISSNSTRMSSLGTDDFATIDTLKRVYGPSNPQVFQALRNMAASQERKGNFPGTIEVWEYLLTAHEEAKHENSFKLVLDLVSMAKCCVRIGEVSAAKHACQRAMTILDSPANRGKHREIVQQIQTIQSSITSVVQT